MLHIEDMSKAYGQTAVIADLTMDFPSTGLHLIAGGNGAGKTTLFKCIAGLETYHGSIKWDGGPTAGLVSAAFEDSPAHDSLTGLQNLSSVLDRPLSHLRSDPLTFEFLTKDRLEKRTKSYSFGQRKKLALTAAFLDTRPCLLLDEPTSSLDGAGRRVLAKRLEASVRSRCVLVSDHDLEFYVGLSPSVYSVADGGLRKVSLGSLLPD